MREAHLLSRQFFHMKTDEVLDDLVVVKADDAELGHGRGGTANGGEVREDRRDFNRELRE
jgi:hypothetical protein